MAAMTEHKEPREFTLAWVRATGDRTRRWRVIDSHGDSTVNERVRVIEAEPVEREMERVRTLLAAQAQGTHELLAHFRDERKRLEGALRAIIDLMPEEPSSGMRAVRDVAQTAVRDIEQEDEPPPFDRAEESMEREF